MDSPILRDLCDETSLPWVVAGDFNELLHADEKDGGPVRREGQMQLFRDTLLYCDLFDLGFSGSPYTWRGSGVRSRLDRVVASPAWANIFIAAKVINLSPIQGDHVPLLLGVYCNPPSLPMQRRSRFRFESFWAQHQGCEDAIREGWDILSTGRAMDQVVHKLRNTRFSLNTWQRTSFGNQSREI